jgi:preprotein translocase subunit SecE
MARETRRQRRDARRASGEQPPQPAPAPAIAGTPGHDPSVAHPATHRGGFIRESVAELKKVDWPTRSQTIQGTIVVIIACGVVGAYLWGLDQVLQPFVREVLLGG